MGKEEALRGLRKRIRRRLNQRRPLEPVFVTGTIGSGTSLVALSLAQYFQSAGLAMESALQVHERSFLRMRLVDDHASLKDYQQRLLPMHPWSTEDGRNDLMRLYAEVASETGRLVIDKGPNTNLVRCNFLHRCFPSAKFVVVFRDPVANIEGFRRKWRLFARASLDENIGFYKQVYGTFLDQSDAFGELVYWLEYESLVRDFEGELASLSSWLGLPLAEVPRALVGTVPNLPGRGIRNVERWHIGVVQHANQEAFARCSIEVAAKIRNRLGSLHQALRRISREAQRRHRFLRASSEGSEPVNSMPCSSCDGRPTPVGMPGVTLTTREAAHETQRDSPFRLP